MKHEDEKLITLAKAKGIIVALAVEAEDSWWTCYNPRTGTMGQARTSSLRRTLLELPDRTAWWHKLWDWFLTLG